MGDGTRYRIFMTAIGARFALLRHPGGELAALWLDLNGGVPRGARPDRTLLGDLSARLERYFAGEPVDFRDVPTPHGTPFHRRCWEACRRVGRGRVATYGRLAALAGAGSAAARAAGGAMRANPLPVIVPCHRVVAAGGGLHGYAGSTDRAGLPLRIKQFLLDLEESPAPAGGSRS